MAGRSILNVAAAQITSVPGDQAANLSKHLDVVAAARAASVDVLVFPELSMAGHGGGAEALRLAIGRDDPVVATIARAAGPMCTTFGIVEEAAGAQFYNAAVTVRGGQVLHVHRKVGLATYGRLEDGKHFGAGERIDPFALAPDWRTAVLVCADTWNPALVHLAAVQGTTLLLVLVSSALEAVGDAFDNPAGWDTNLRFHALTYGMPVVMANRVGVEDGLTFWGGSRIVDPFGRTVAAAPGDAEALVTATIDFDDVRRARYLLPTVRDANLPLVQRELARLLQAERPSRILTGAMRDYILDDADRAFRADVRDFLARELAPRAAAIEERDDWEAIKAVVRALGEAGYLKLMFRDLYEGPLSAPGLTHATILSEEAARLNYAFETTIATALSCAYPLQRHATPAIRDRYLPGIVEGRMVGAICVTEPTAGSDTSGLRTTLAFDAASGEYVVNGQKRYISNAAVADVYIVYGITDPAAPPGKGLSALVVPRDTAGLSFPRRYTFMGRRGCVVGEVAFDGCRVPADHLLGAPGTGHRIMQGMFNFERVILGGSSLGVARSAFEIACDHAQSREAFGQKLGSKQLVWSDIADMSWRIDAAELLTYRAAKLYDAGASPRELMKPAAMAKLVATETATFCADRTVQILGGDGLTREYGRAEQIYRDARALPIVGGTSEMARYLIASADLPTLKLNL